MIRLFDCQDHTDCQYQGSEQDVSSNTVGVVIFDTHGDVHSLVRCDLKILGIQLETDG